MNEQASVFLKPGKERPVQRFHPWIFSGAISKIIGKPANGEIVVIKDANGNFLAKGHYQNGSIAVRIISFEDTTIDQKFWDDKINQALQKRKIVGFPNERTNCFRLIHAEGDGLPGLIVDVYAQVAVVQCHSTGMYQEREYIAKAIMNTCSEFITAVYDKSAESLSLGEGNGFLIGDAEISAVFENGHAFKVDFKSGQKTGFFLDQRDNRSLLSMYSKNMKVLNTFCYTGGFSVYALKAGASLVHSVDSSKRVIELTEENIQLNTPFEGKHDAILADVPEWLKTQEEKYDVIILDPPAFAKHQNARHRAVQAYKRLNKTAIQNISPNGILFTFSCSQVVDRELFRHTITAAAIEAGRKVSILHQLTQPADHPVSIYHPEGEYLKGLVLFIH